MIWKIMMIFISVVVLHIVGHYSKCDLSKKKKGGNLVHSFCFKVVNWWVFCCQHLFLKGHLTWHPPSHGVCVKEIWLSQPVLNNWNVKMWHVHIELPDHIIPPPSFLQSWQIDCSYKRNVIRVYWKKKVILFC